MTLAEALETLTLLPGWEERYSFVLELAKHLPPMPENEKVEANLVRGCTSQVWLTAHTQGQGEGATLHLNLASDAHIVSGLLALIHLAYNGQTLAHIRALNLPELLAPTQLLGHLSPNRRNGFASVIARIQSLAGSQRLV